MLVGSLALVKIALSPEQNPGGTRGIRGTLTQPGYRSPAPPAGVAQTVPSRLEFPGNRYGGPSDPHRCS